MLYEFCRIPWTGDQPVARPLLHTGQHKQKNPYRHVCLKWDTNPVFERAKTVHALDRAATVIGALTIYMHHVLRSSVDV
jgi:hypothetical protein